MAVGTNNWSRQRRIDGIVAGKSKDAAGCITYSAKIMRDVRRFKRNVVARCIDRATGVPHSSESRNYLFTKYLFVDVRCGKQQFTDIRKCAVRARFERVCDDAVTHTMCNQVYLCRAKCGNVIQHLVERRLRKLSHLFVSKVAACAPGRGPAKKQREPAERQIARQLSSPQGCVSERRIESMDKYQNALGLGGA